MSRIALAGESPGDELRDAIVAAGHELVESDRCDALVHVLSAVGPGVPATVVPSIAMIARTADPLARGFDESVQSALETVADAYSLGTRWIGNAIAWVTSEDRARRAQGQPRLTVIGTMRDDFGMSRPLTAEPMTLGRSSSFSREHPMRPDRMPTHAGTIARHHARARFLDGRVEVCDLRSTNGTLLIQPGEPARLLCPQELGGNHPYGPPAAPWLVREPTLDYRPLAFGGHLQLPGFWRFRVDGDPAWEPD